MSATVMYDYTICFYIKVFRSLQHSLSKIFCLKLPEVLVNFGKISTGRDRILTGNPRLPALNSTYA